jgi:outer membrane protein OmpA-like peptidoglycan-associated protein
VTITPDGLGDVEIEIAGGVVTDNAGQANLPTTAPILIRLIDVIEVVSEVLSDDLLRTTMVLSQNASNISRRAADRLRPTTGQQCGLEINALLQASPAQFASDSFVLDARNNALLDNITEILSECATSSYLIAGHTDSDASDSYNDVLSQNRVDAVKAALIQRGIAGERLQTRGFGEQRPIADNATEEGKAMNRRVEFILLDDVAAIELACSAVNPLGGTLDGNANSEGGNLAAVFGADGYNCVTGVRTETWGELNVTHDEDRGTVGMFNFGVSKETQADNVLRGRFVEGYVSQNSVDTGTVEGTITGVGVHAGLYGAQSSEGGLVFSYYGSAAVGQHTFELEAGTDVDGNYTYAGVFAGAAVGGERDLGSFTFKPRSGIDLAYSQAIGSEISIPGTLDIEPATYARGFVELGFIQQADASSGTLEVTPRLFCETNQDADTDACGFGGSIDYSTTASDVGTQWNVKFDYEAIDNRQTASLAVARSQDILNGLGVARSSFGASATGAIQAEQTIAFTW